MALYANDPRLDFFDGVADFATLANPNMYAIAVVEALSLLDIDLIGSPILDYLHSLTSAEATAPIRRYDPLTLDLNHNGTIDLVSINNSTAFFDLDDDTLREKVGWIKPTDGLLVLDENNNGSVDNINELFGHSNEDGTQTTGTQELATHDSNSDEKIDSSDSVFSQLKVWQDLDQDGITDAGELTSLSSHNITSINLTATTVNQNIEGNVILSTGTYNYTDTKGASQTSSYANLNLAIDQTNSSSYTYQDAGGNTIGYTLNLETLNLPFSRGYGNTKAWHIAMSESPALLQIMKDITNLTGGVTYQNLNSKIEEFIYEWTGIATNGISNITGMRGGFDGKKLAAMEAIRGIIYTDLNGFFVTTKPQKQPKWLFLAINENFCGAKISGVSCLQAEGAEKQRNVLKQNLVLKNLNTNQVCFFTTTKETFANDNFANDNFVNQTVKKYC